MGESEDTFWAVRQRIQHQFERYIWCSLARWRGIDRNRFTGGMDALFDTEHALHSLSNGLPSSEAAAKLAAYGFLQALYVQADAVAEIETALGLDKLSLANGDVEQIRDIRNRLVGHPARRERGKKTRPSTGVLSLTRIADGLILEGGIYYDDGFEIVRIDVADYIQRMRLGLTPALVAVEDEMRNREEAFRAAERPSLFIDLLDYDFGYSVGKVSSAARDPDRLSLVT